MAHHHENKNVKYWIGGAIVVLILLWLWLRRMNLNANNTGIPPLPAPAPPNSNWNYNPELITYMTDPSKWGPLTVDGLVNVSVSGYNGLNQNYMPLFGFVGMAQGVMWGRGYGGGVIQGATS